MSGNDGRTGVGFLCAVAIAATAAEAQKAQGEQIWTRLFVRASRMLLVFFFKQLL